MADINSLTYSEIQTALRQLRDFKSCMITTRKFAIEENQDFNKFSWANYENLYGNLTNKFFKISQPNRQLIDNKIQESAVYSEKKLLQLYEEIIAQDFGTYEDSAIYVREMIKAIGKVVKLLVRRSKGLQAENSSETVESIVNAPAPVIEPQISQEDIIANERINTVEKQMKGYFDISEISEDGSKVIKDYNTILPREDILIFREILLRENQEAEKYEETLKKEVTHFV